jgi:hypothetical protein
MAELIKTSIPFGSMSAPVKFTAATGNDYFVPDNADGRIGIIVKNSNTVGATVTLKAGDGSLSSLGDVSVKAAAGETVYIPLVRAESARVKVTKGADKGKIFVGTAVETNGNVGSVSFGIISAE